MYISFLTKSRYFTIKNIFLENIVERKEKYHMLQVQTLTKF